MSLEYEEEDDLFGDNNDDIIAATPLLTRPTPTHLTASSARPGPSEAGPSTRIYSYPISVNARKQVQDEVRARMDELREKKRRSAAKERRVTGPSSLRECCMTVVRVNASRIWDIGDMEYPIIHQFLDELPREQLEEIEHNSQHIRKDTDWLWELFLIEEYPLFHERCRERQGEQRTSGWRRMYKKAKEDAEERQASAVNRVAERYRQLEEEKAAKRIVVMDKLVPDKKAKRGIAPGRSRGGFSGGGSRSTAPVGALAKARAEAQRARVAMTHASGKYVPPPSRPKPAATRQPDLFKNPYLTPNRSTAQGLSSPSSPARPTVAGPRIPPPRARAAGPSHPAQSSDDPIQGSFRTAELNTHRKALPLHLANSTGSAASPPGERLRLPEKGNQTKYKEVRRPEVANFEPPRKNGVIVDFFGDDRPGPKGFLDSLKRSNVAAAEAHDGKVSGEKRKGTVEEGIFVKKKKVPPGR